MYNKVELCGVNTAELPILSEQEKRDLLTRARAGDKKARQSMIEGNLRLVLSVCSAFRSGARTWTTCFRWGASAHQGHRQLRSGPAGAGSPPTVCR